MLWNRKSKALRMGSVMIRLKGRIGMARDLVLTNKRKNDEAGVLRQCIERGKRGKRWQEERKEKRRRNGDISSLL